MFGLVWSGRRLWLSARLGNAFVLDMAGPAAADVPPAADVNTIASGLRGRHRDPGRKELRWRRRRRNSSRSIANR